MKKILFSFFIFGCIALPTYAGGTADMYISLDKAQVTEQGSVTGTVYVSSGQTAINNAESIVHFPADLLSVSSLSTSNSIFNIWVEQPRFSNTDGTITFNGGLPTPGFIGQSGSVLTVHFKAKASGSANISFEAPAVRANDGKGTDVLAQARGTSLSIITKSVPTTDTTKSAPIDVLAGTPKAPIITSKDIPDPAEWYNKTQATFTWDVPSDASILRLILADSADVAPTISYNPPINSKTITNLSEGVQYLNARFKNDTGWGQIASLKIQVDLTSPENLTVKTSVVEKDLIQLDVSAKDSVSGVKYFAAYKNNQQIGRGLATAQGNTKFNLPPLPEGTNTFIVKAFDYAGNHKDTEVTVEAPTVKTPRITHYPESVKTGSKIEIRGKAPYAEGKILVWIKMDGVETKSLPIKPDEDGIFSYTIDNIMNSGTVAIWAQTVRAPSIMSGPSEKIFISIKESDTVVIGTKVLQTISLVITVLVLISGLLYLVYLIINKINSVKRKLRRERIHTEQQIHKVFEILKSDTRRYIKMLEMASIKRKLTKEETKILSELTENLHETEAYLNEKIESSDK